MTRAISIRPSKELRSNYSQISSLARQNPVEIAAHLAQAVDDVKLGRVQAVDDAFDDILAELDELKNMLY